MNTSSALRSTLAMAALLSLVTMVSAGGWDIVTLKDFPDFAVAGKSLSLTFRVWVPSEAPLRGLHPVVRATHARGLEIKANTEAGSTAGEFTAALMLPEPGD